MSPERLRKIALYLEYIAFVLRDEPGIPEGMKPDWRIGMNCKPKYSTHQLFGCAHNFVIVDTRRSSLFENGLLLIAVDDGRQLLESSDDWVTE